MSEPLVTQRDLEGLLRRLRAIEERVGRSEVRESPQYETGTYTPTYLGATPGVTTYSVQQGNYVRMGNVVFAWGQLIWTAATGTGNAVVSLPFAATSTANVAFAGAVDLLGVTFTNSTPVAELVASGTGFVMRSPLTNANGAVVQVETAGRIIFTMTYAID